ncbi:MAG: hypothetical protein JWQ04_577 [Pedosphaera sp.]|nr:hypothetical protein [Pedosphaera sp.]
MFDLEEKITQWRQQMLVAGIKAPEPLDELENHLREEIERHVKAGSNVQSSFENAINKLGAADMLKSEFDKIGAAKEARAVKQAQIMIVGSLIAVSGFAIFITALLLFRIGNFSELTSRQQMSGLTAVALMLLFGFGGRLSYRFFPCIGRKRVRDAVCVSGAVLLALWWTIFFWVIAQRYEYTIGQLCLAVVWCFAMPFGGLLGLCAGIESAARKSVLANS